MSYKGCFVFTCCPEMDYQGDAGEYFVIDETHFGLIGISTKGGWGSSRVTNLLREGKGRHRITSSHRDDAAARRLVGRLLDFVNEMNKPSKNWSDSVYYGVQANAGAILRVLAELDATAQVAPKSPPGMTPDELWKKWVGDGRRPSRWSVASQEAFLRDIRSCGSWPSENPIHVVIYPGK